MTDRRFDGIVEILEQNMRVSETAEAVLRFIDTFEDNDSLGRDLQAAQESLEAAELDSHYARSPEVRLQADAQARTCRRAIKAIKDQLGETPISGRG